MTTAAITNKAAWQAGVSWRKRCYTTQEQTPHREIEEPVDGATAEPTTNGTVTVVHSVMACFVDVGLPGGQRISFGVNHREGRDITFSDPRDRTAGTVGVTGI